MSAAIPAVAQETPRVEWTLLYSHVWIHDTKSVNIADPRPFTTPTAPILNFGIPSFDAQGASTSLAVNLTNHFGIVFEGGGFYNSGVPGFGIDNRWLTYMAGPRLSLRSRGSRIVPSIHALFGGVHSSGDIFIPQDFAGVTSTSGAKLKNVENGFAMAAGVALDIRITRHIFFRPGQLDYFMTRLRGNSLDGFNRFNQNNIRYQGGIMFAFGGETPQPARAAAPPPPPPPPAKKDITLGVRADKTEVCPGETVHITPTSDVTGTDVNYAWSVNGEPVSKGESFDFGTAGRQPGTYTISVAATGEPYNPASAQTTVTVKEYKPPSGTLVATPPEVYVGEKVTLTPRFEGQCAQVQSTTYTASECAVSGDQWDSSCVQFEPSTDNAEQRKTVVLTATASDGRSTGTATANVVVKKKALMAAQRLPDIIFPAGNSRVNNCGKRVLLEELKSYTDKDPTGRVVFVGHTSPDEQQADLDRKRAMNAAAVVSAGSGICLAVPANQVFITAAGSEQGDAGFQPNFCGTSTDERSGQAINASDATAQERRVEVWFVPTGGAMPAGLKDFQEAGALSVGSLGCPK
ncbi:MAG: hypothetical protein ACM336_10110 [Acidobacteriota bacterium]